MNLLSIKENLPMRLGLACTIHLSFACTMVLAQNSASLSEGISHKQTTAHVPQRIQFDTFSYQAFIHFVGSEDARLRGNMRDGEAQDAKSGDYSVEMGIDLDEDQTMRGIVLDAYQKQRDLNTRKGCDSAEDEVQRAIEKRIDEGTIETLRERSRTCDREELMIAAATANELMKSLKPESFTKLDWYVCTRRWGPKMELVNRCQPHLSPGPGETAHKGCGFEYERYFELLSEAYDNEKKSAGEAKEPDLNHYEMMVPLSLQQKQAVMSIAREFTHDLAEWRGHLVTARDQYAQDHHLLVVGAPYPPQLTALDNEGLTIFEKHIAELKDVIGDQLFTLLDITIYAESNKLEPAEK